MIPVPLILAGLEFLKGVYPVVSAALQKDDVRARNVEIGGALLDTATKVTNSANFQEAIQKIQEDPAAKKAVDDALRIQLPELIEAGGGGIDGARKAAATPDGDWKKVVFTFPFILAVAVLPLVYAVVLAALVKFPWLAEFSDDARMMVITAVINLILGSLIGYVYGQSMQQKGLRSTDK